MQKKIQKNFLVSEIIASVLSNRIFLNLYLNTFFGVLTFGNKSAMRFFFFWKAFKI